MNKKIKTIGKVLGGCVATIIGIVVLLIALLGVLILALEIFLPPVFGGEIETTGFPTEYVKSLPDAPMKGEVPEQHTYKLEQHNAMCVACAIIRGGETMLELEGRSNENYVIAWSHFAGRNVSTNYSDDLIGIYGSDAALAIEQIGFLPASALEGVDKNLWNADRVSKLEYTEETWESFYNKYKDKAEKYPIAYPTNVNEIALCLSKGLPVLFLSSAQWKLISWRNVDGKGNNRFEFATTQYNTTEAHVVCLRDYYTLPYFKDGKSYPMEYCNLINSHGELPSPLKLFWLDKIQADNKFSCFVILPKSFFTNK
jgi:hypothetical protein